MRRIRVALLLPVIGTLYLVTTPAVAQDDEFAPVQAMLQTCFACHGDKGAAPLEKNPVLAGQEFYYLYVQLKDFKSGLRKSDIMGPVAQALEPDQLKLLAQFFSKQTWPATAHTQDPAKKPAVKPALDAGACISCHLGDFRGNSRVPRLAGQKLDYLTQTLLDFKTKARNNAPAMASLMATFSDDDISSLADYLASLTVYQSAQTGEIQ